MNITLIPKVLDVLRKGHSFADDVKSGKQAAIAAGLAALLAALAPLLGSQINAHPWIAYFFTEQGIQVVAALIAGVVGLVYHFGSSADRGLLPAKPVDSAAVAGEVRGPSAGEQGPLAAQAGSEQTNAGVANQVRPSGDPSNPSSGYLPG
jgi:hypothetical protein